MDLRERLKMRTFNLYRCRMCQNKLRDIMIKFYDSVDEVTGDTRLTDQGKSEKLRSVGNDYLGQIGKLKTEAAYLPPIERQLEDLQRQIAPPQSKDKEQGVSDTLREIEARQFLMRKDETERVVLLFQAAERGDEIFYNAALNAPKMFELVDDETIEKLRERWAAMQKPGVYNEYQRSS